MYSKKGPTGRLNTKFHNPRCIVNDFRAIGRKLGEGGSHLRNNLRNNLFISSKWRRNLKRGYIKFFIVLSGKLKIYDKHKKVVECRCNGSCHICVRLKTTVFAQHTHVTHCPRTTPHKFLTTLSRVWGSFQHDFLRFSWK